MTRLDRRERDDYEVEALREMMEDDDRPEMSDVLNAILHPEWPGGPRTFRTYVALYLRTSVGKCEVWPSMETIANDARVSVSTAYRDLKELEEGGLVVCLPGRKTRDGRWHGNAYLLPRRPVERLGQQIVEYRRAGRRGAPSVTSARTPSVSGAKSRRSPATDKVVSVKVFEVVSKQQAGLNPSVEPRLSRSVGDTPPRTESLYGLGREA